MDGQHKCILRAIIPDIVMLAALAFSEFYFVFRIDPFKRGFFCDDNSIRYPFHESTIPSIVLNIVGVGSAIFSILLVEANRNKEFKDKATGYTLGKYKIVHWQLNVYRMTVGFGFGALCNQLITEIGKKSIGRLRPNFWSVCDPNIKDCSNGTSFYKYITDYTCTNPHYTESDFKDIRVSFPSGHSSFSFYCAIFVILYLQARWSDSKHVNAIRPAIQFIVLMAAWFTALSRVMDNKHHWSDVLSGIIIGTLVATVNTVVIMRLFNSSVKKTDDILNGDSPNNVNNEIHVQL